MTEAPRCALWHVLIVNDTTVCLISAKRVAVILNILNTHTNNNNNNIKGKRKLWEVINVCMALLVVTDAQIFTYLNKVA